MSAAPLFKLTALWKARALFRHPGKILRVFRDERTPFLAKLLPILAIIYIFFPFDIAPDFIPFIGQIDDLTIALYVFSYALSMVPDAVFKDAGLSEKQRRVT